MVQNERVSLSAATGSAVRQVAELRGHETDGVTGVERTDEGWKVWVEVIELRRIPDTNDLLALYQTELDSGGELLSYRRIKRYPRGRAEGVEG